MNNVKTICLVGPSGVGKSAICDVLVAEAKKSESKSTTDDNGIEEVLYEKPRTACTRAQRPGEADDAYFFLTKEQFSQGIKEKIFLETTEYAGEMYGTPKFAVDTILEKGNIAVVPIDINGAKAYKEIYGDTVMLVFVYRPKRAVIEAIMKRDIPIEEKSRRIMQLDNEYNNIDFCDRCVINNGSIEEAAEVVKSFRLV